MQYFRLYSRDGRQSKRSKERTSSVIKKQTATMKSILLYMMIGFAIRAHLSVFINLSLFDEVTTKQIANIHEEEEQENKRTNRTIWINAIQKLYNGGHLNRDYAKYILTEGRDLMAKLPSFYNVSLPTIHDYEKEKTSRKRSTVRSSFITLSQPLPF